MDTSMEGTAAPHRSGPNDSAVCSRASNDDYVGFFFSGINLFFTSTSATSTTPATTTPTVPHVPTTGAGNGSDFVAHHGTCRVPLCRYLIKMKSVCNATV